MEGTMSPLLFREIFEMNESDIRHLAEQWAKENDCFLVNVRVSTSRIQVFLDSFIGVSISTCSALSRYLASELETTNLLETHDLEVSSPGIDQPFKVKQQYQKAVGRPVRVILTDGNEINGELAEVKEEGIVVKQVLKEKEGKKKVTKEKYTEAPFDKIKEAKEKLIF